MCPKNKQKGYFSSSQNEFGTMEVYPEGQINKIGKTAMKILGIKVYRIHKKEMGHHCMEGDGTLVHEASKIF
jgi:hypothetical protein